MVVRIRLMRLGCRNHPFYRVIATDSRTTRDGKHLEVLGYYNPTGKKDKQRVSLKLERVKYWLSVGAQPSDPVERLLSQAGLHPSPPMVVMEPQSDKYLVDALTAHTLNQDQPANTNLNPNEEEDGTTSPEAIFSIGLKVN